MVFLIPACDLKVTDPPVPDGQLTEILQNPVVKLPVIKYVSLLRGEDQCQKHGY